MLSVDVGICIFRTDGERRTRPTTRALKMASDSIARGIPSQFCSGFNLLSEEQQEAANETALTALNGWLESRGMAAVDMHEALSYGRQVEIY